MGHIVDTLQIEALEALLSRHVNMASSNQQLHDTWNYLSRE